MTWVLVGLCSHRFERFHLLSWGGPTRTRVIVDSQKKKLAVRYDAGPCGSNPAQSVSPEVEPLADYNVSGWITYSIMLTSYQFIATTDYL